VASIEHEAHIGRSQRLQRSSVWRFGGREQTGAAGVWSWVTRETVPTADG